MARASGTAIVFPPIGASRDFIDYPYFADLDAVQAASAARAAGGNIALTDLCQSGERVVEAPSE